MDILEIMKNRHSVRQYLTTPIEIEKRNALQEVVDECNKEGNMEIRVIYDEPKCFGSIVARYGRFSGCCNYIVVMGKKDDLLDEKAGYYGERIVLKAQELGLNTCWVALTRGKVATRPSKGNKIAIVIALGYGVTQGIPHKNRPIEEVCNLNEDSPDWFKKGMEAVMLAPTAMNQQKFYFEYQNGLAKVSTKTLICAGIDLGIVKCHFEMMAGKKLINK